MFFYGYMYSLLLVTIPLALVVISVRAIWLAVVPPRRSVKEPSCEKCRYPVAGLSTLTCPECGSNLLQYGIITRPMEARRRGSYVGAIAGLFTIVFGCATAGMIATEEICGWSAGTISAPPPIWSTTVTPSSGLYNSLLVTQTDRMASGYGFQSAVLTMDVGDQSYQVYIDVTDGLSYYTVGPTGTMTVTGAIDAQAITDWLRRAGVDVSSAAVVREVGELDALIKGWTTKWAAPTSLDLPSFQVSATVTTNAQLITVEGYVALMWSIPAVGVLLFVLCAALIIRRRRKLLREIDTPVPTPTPAPSA